MTFISVLDLNEYKCTCDNYHSDAILCRSCVWFYCRWEQQCSPVRRNTCPEGPACLRTAARQGMFLVWRANKSRNMQAEQKDILKTLKWRKKILSCIPESVIDNFLQALHLYNLPNYKFSITFKNFHWEPSYTAMQNSFVSITIRMSSTLFYHQIKCLGVHLGVCWVFCF